MSLAVMLREDKDALMCDLAETYHVFDIRELPVETLATLACGLRENSRIKMKLAGYKYLATEIILPQIFDVLVALAVDRESRPMSLTEIMIGKSGEKQSKGFDSGADFMAERERLVRKYTNG